MPELDQPIAGSVSGQRRLHWRRFRRLMAFMAGVATLAVGGSLWALQRDGVVLHLQFVIAMGLGITVSLLLAGALMGLVFLSANSGHDDAVIDPAGDPDRERRGRPFAGPPSSDTDGSA